MDTQNPAQGRSVPHRQGAHTHTHTQIKLYISLKATFTHTKTQAHTLHTYIAIMSIMTEQLLTEVDDSWNSSAEK